jgi:iron complex outermembrane receptor protein
MPNDQLAAVATYRARKGWLLAGAALVALLPRTGLAQSAAPDNSQLVAQAAPPAVTTADAAASTPAAPEEVIVTGTRQFNRTKNDSLAPVDVISGAALQATGQQNLFDALNAVLPSLDLPKFGFDTAGLVRAARLRGLSPDDTLVLIDGKRRHVSANINADIGPVGGSDPVDFDMIPLSLIDHVEVLRDGAAAQYGSDAVAGVINVILKHADHGGSAYAQEGQNYAGDGFTNNLGGSYGFSLNGNGFFDISADYRYHDHTNRDGSFIGQTGAPGDENPLVANGVQGGPHVIPKNISQIEGDPRYNVVNLGYNTAYTIEDITLYSNATYGYRHAEAFENFRDPNYGGAYGDSPLTAQYYPNGFTPLEAFNEDDYAGTIGIKGVFGDNWNWDLSSTYGGDIDNVSTLSSINPDFANAFGYSPTKFHAGEFNNSEWTTNLDVNKPVGVPIFAAPLNVAFGAEFRRNTYQLEPGDFPAYFEGGSQAYPGFSPAAAGSYHRTNEAGYIDLATDPIENWHVDLAGRFEHYSDVGDTETGKFTTRYDFSPQFGIRGTISNGFRAPSLAQEGFAAVNVAPTNAIAQFPVNSPGARLLGSIPLKAERSQNYTAGFVATPIEHMHLAVDVYWIDIRDQIEDSGLFSGPLVAEAFALNGSGVPAGAAGSIFAQFYTNGVSTRTQGGDLTWDYVTYLGEDSRINWLIASNLNSIVITHQEASAGFTPDVISEIKDATPKSKTVFQAVYTGDPWSLTLRGTRYGQAAEVLADGYTGGAPFTYNRSRPTWIADMEIGYKITPELVFTLGADNLFDKYADKTTPYARYQNAEQYILATPWGIDGGFYYARVSYKFGAAPPPPPPPPEVVAPPPPAAIPVRTYLVFFDWDRADLTNRAKQIVDSAAEASTHVQTTRIEVDGYTDLSGTAAYNQRLSVRRAQSVQTELVHDGVPAGEIAIHGYGESNPLVPTAPGVREPQNRRVEIVLK